MKRSTALRLAALWGLALAAVTAAWWLGSTRLALDDGADAGRSATDALWLAWFVRATVLLLLGLRTGLLRGWRTGSAEAFALSAPAWPVAALAWAASPWPWTQVVAAEGLLLAVGLLLPVIGQRLGSVLRRSDLADALAMLLGVALAAALWYARGTWMAVWRWAAG